MVGEISWRICILLVIQQEPLRNSLNSYVNMISESWPMSEAFQAAVAILTSTEEAEDHSGVSLRLQQVFDIFKTGQRTTPKQLAKLLGIATNTGHLRELEEFGRCSKGETRTVRDSFATLKQARIRDVLLFWLS